MLEDDLALRFALRRACIFLKYESTGLNARNMYPQDTPNEYLTGIIRHSHMLSTGEPKKFKKILTSSTEHLNQISS